MSTSPELASDPSWLARCQAAALDPQARFAARQAVLDDATALDATLYRADEEDEDAEEEDLGDARVLIEGPFVIPADWSEADREAYFDGSDPALFVQARIECLAPASSRQHFTPEPGDQVALTRPDGLVEMYFLYEAFEDDHGHHCVLIRDEDALF